MSADAINRVLQHSRARGAQRNILILIAHASQERGYYPKSTIGAGTLAAWSGLCERRVRVILAELIAKGRLLMVNRGGGEDSNTYEIPLLKPYPGGVIETAGVRQRQRREQASRADSRCEETPSAPAVPPNILPMPVTYQKPKRKRGAGG